jgi:hypothetical protein
MKLEEVMIFRLLEEPMLNRLPRTAPPVSRYAIKELSLFDLAFF